ncbi:MAG TPA: 5-formyltetrahydrofolate cyclo-ligase [Aquabacterium sp.]|nr:5-formyltetrahydrofolate cyclo-ligase [Aquabacterium sp.]
MSAPDPTLSRTDLRQRLLAARRAWATCSEAQAAQQALEERLTEVLDQLEPDCLGLYWPMTGEFNPRDVALSARERLGCRLALPCAQREPVALHFRAWDGAEPDGVDGCGLPCPAEGGPIVPDVVLVPCLGYTVEGFRLGYGGGYFDRFLAAHPGVTAIGLGWDQGRLTAAELAPQAHDIALMAVLTESHTWG